MNETYSASERTKAGLAAAVASIVEGANTHAERLRPVLVELKEWSANAAAAELDRRGFARPRGGKWSATAVIRTRQRLGIAGTKCNANTFAARLAPIMAELSDLSANAAAAALDRRGIARPRGGTWSAHGVIDVRARLVAL